MIMCATTTEMGSPTVLEVGGSEVIYACLLASEVAACHLVLCLIDV